MRIVGGQFGGRRLHSVKGEIRPTTDRLRESLFNVLGESIVGATCLDLFAGSGALGLEALSRGAREVVFNDRSRAAIDLIGRNVSELGVSARAKIVRLDAFACLRKYGDWSFQIIFLDPPYQSSIHRKVLGKLASADYLRDDPLITLEIFKKKKLIVPEQLREVRRISAGDSLLVLLRRRLEETDSENREPPD